ncbi:hypothetical protein F4801DRAFT_569923 [Xylaria longipes]|nr:hypothetical protein F4801DRAFT_569923 [Xylaria longipes]
MLSSTIKNILLLAFSGSAVALPVESYNANKRDPKKDTGIGITFKYPIFKVSEGGDVEKRGSDAITFKYPIFKATEGASKDEVQKRGSDAITFRYPIFKATEGTGDCEVEKRGSNAITFKCPIFKANEGGAEKREPMGPYADAIAAADSRDILGQRQKPTSRLQLSTARVSRFL